MSETKNTQENETERDASENKTEKDAPIYFLSDPFTNKQLQYEFILFLILSHNIDPLDQEALAEILHRVKGDFDKDIIRQAVIDAQMKAKEDAHNKLTKKLTPEKYDQVAKKWSEAIKKTFDEMSGTRSTQENETDQKLPIDEEGEAIQGNFQIKSFREKEDISNLDVERAMNAGKEEWDAVVKQVKGLQFTIIPLLIDEEPLTPQTLALAFSALTELTTKLWLIAQHRFADLIEYTQTHDVRFANEAGSTIAYVTYNSPFNFGLQVDKLVPGVADAVMTIVDGLSQRKAKREKVEIDNQASAERIKEAAEALKQQQRYSELEREKIELGLERMILENEKERQALVEQRLESRIKQVEYALELAGKAVDTVYPNSDAEMRPILIQTLVNNILQIDSVEGLQLQLALPENSSIKTRTKEDAGQ